MCLNLNILYDKIHFCTQEKTKLDIQKRTSRNFNKTVVICMRIDNFNIFFLTFKEWNVKAGAFIHIT